MLPTKYVVVASIVSAKEVNMGLEVEQTLPVSSHLALPEPQATFFCAAESQTDL